MWIDKTVIINLVFVVFGRQKRSVTKQIENTGNFNMTYTGNVTYSEVINYQFDYRETTNVCMSVCYHFLVKQVKYKKT